MKIHADFDAGPLSWVKGEIDLAMQRGLESLRGFSADTGDFNKIRSVQMQLHQAHGALQIVGLDGVTRVSEELESLVGDLEKEPSARTRQNFELAEEAFETIVAYLDALIAGSPNQPLKLLPLYRRLLAARGQAAADPVDLFFPSLSGRPTPRDPPPVGRASEGDGKLFREQRGRFQRGLLTWIKGDKGGAAEMRAAVEAIEAVQVTNAQRAFWWAAIAFFDALVADALPPDVDAKRLCNRIDQQFRRLVEGSQNVAERLLRETLYQVARARKATAQIQAVQEAYDLARALPADEGTAQPPVDLASLKVARGILAQAKDAWNIYAAGNHPSLGAFRDLCGPLNDRAAELGNPDVAAIVDEIGALATWLGGSPSNMSEAIALEVATALLLLENALANYSELGAEFGKQSRFVCDRLKACVRGKLLRTPPTLPLLDEMSRRAQERLVLSQVVAEMQANLRAIEKVLEAFYRDPARRADLATLGGPLHQVKGALDMLGEARAADALAECEERIARLARADGVPRQQEFEQLAQLLSGLGFYIEALVSGTADFDAAMRPVSAKRIPADEREPADLQPSVEVQLERQKREAQNLIQECKARPSDARRKSELRKIFAAIQRDAGLVGDAVLESKALHALHALDTAAGQALLEPKLVQALEDAVPAMETPPLSPGTDRLIDASEEKLDAELLGIYLEEADEVLARIRDQLDLMRSHPADKPALTTIRRAFHTLKGSGRMVGLVRVGEAAWAVEQAINLWLQDERPATRDLLSLISEAHDYFADCVVRLKAGGVAADEAPLIELAAELGGGRPPRLRPAPDVVAETAASPAPPVAAADVSKQGDFVAIGEQSVSRALFEAFIGEARMYLRTMTQEREVLAQQAVITDAFIRAAHTLGGISGTLGLDSVRSLAQALDSALRLLATLPVSEIEERLVGGLIDALCEMIDEASSYRVPRARPDLIEKLHRATVPALVEEESPTMLPEEEGALSREDDASSPVVADDEVPAAASPAALAPLLGPTPGKMTSTSPPIAEAPVEGESGERRRRRMRDEPDAQLMPLFLQEANELLPAVADTLRGWRATPQDASMGQSLARLLHTLKGGARMAGAMGIGELTHQMETRVENALALKALPETLFDALDNSCDRLGVLVEAARSETTRESSADVTAAPQRPAAGPDSQDVLLPSAMLRVKAEMVDRLVNQAGEVSIARSRIEGGMRTVRAAMQELTDNVGRLRSQLREIEIQAESQMQSRMRELRDTKQGFDPLEFDRFTGFQELTRLMAESVNDVQTVHQNLIHAVDQTEAGLLSQARLNRDLQQNLMRVRMVPFASLSERLYRVVRQTAKEIGKRVNLELRGAQVELDRSVLERITAPFEHLLRNAVTHGIESPADRKAMGKPEIGEIRLDVTQEGNDVLLALADDGRGLDIARIRETAVATGLMDERNALSDAEIADFIFRPGFTTATKLTEIAGRGVGMDVVRTEVASLGGRIEFEFQRDRGTRFVVYLPLTLAVTQALLVKGSGRTYAVPAVMIEQARQLKVEELALAYAEHRASWQSRHYPFHFLPHLLGTPAARPESRRYSPVLFLRSGANAIALHVDEILGSTQEIVVKAVGPQLQRIPGITGATVIGSGEIVLILNPVQLALREIRGVGSEARPETAVPHPARPTVMVMDDPLTVRKITGRMLVREGYEVVVAKDGVDAIEKLQDIVPDVMLVDIEMPRMDGFELTRNVRADPRLAEVPIIIITSRTADKHQDYAREMGASAFLGKPYQEDELLGRIGDLIKLRTAA